MKLSEQTMGRGRAIVWIMTGDASVTGTPYDPHLVLWLLPAVPLCGRDWIFFITTMLQRKKKKRKLKDSYYQGLLCAPLLRLQPKIWHHRSQSR